jgi:hypothetical protein
MPERRKSKRYTIDENGKKVECVDRRQNN